MWQGLSKLYMYNYTKFFTIFSRILPLAEGQWQDCSVLFCARAQKVQNKGWRTTGKSGFVG